MLIKVDFKLTAHSICDMMAKAIFRFDPDDLAYLFATGKNELFLRDHLAAFMNKHLGLKGDEFIGREWKKHDLTVNDGHGLHAIIEGKSYIQFYIIFKEFIKEGIISNRI